MKLFIKALLLPCLFLGLTSCALLPKKKAGPKADLRPMIASGEEASRRQAGLSGQGAEEREKSSRRRLITESGVEKILLTGADEKTGLDKTAYFEDEKSVPIFEPYDPEKPSEKGSVEQFEEGLPQEIKEELLGLTKKEEDYVTLNFEQAPIAQILNAVSETLGINFIMTPGVKGDITMQTSKPVPASDLFQILQSVLEVNGLTLVKSGRYYKVVFGKEAKQYPLRVLSGKEGEGLPSEDTFITQIIPLDYIPVKDMVNIVQPFLSKSAPPVIQHEELNILIINDLASNMKRLLRFVQELDKPLYQPKEKVYVYYVENGDAEKLASTLNSIYKKTDKTKGFPFSPVTGEKPGEQAQKAVQPQQIIQTPYGPLALPESVSGEVHITSDKEINALIIVTSPRDYPAVLETIKKLDVMPKQALIEALIVDVTLTDRTEFGIGWYLKGREQSLGANISKLDLSSYVGPETFSSIFGYKLITDSGRFSAFMRQLSEMTNLNVVSSPYIMALDNQKATIHITREQPIAKWTDVGTTATGVTRLERTFDYKSVGLKLDVTPKINENNMMTLEIEQEVSEIAEITEDGAVAVNKRTANSKVVVKDSQTIIIGGLIQNKVDKSKSGIPFLSDIPLIGRLFGSNRDTVQKTELLIFITPHVIDNQKDIGEITSQFEKKVESVKALTKTTNKSQE
ncbi:hypothetical protein JXL19_03570 [bacterium]|nr:hypothetical protein [bacterium]